MPVHLCSGHVDTTCTRSADADSSGVSLAIASLALSLALTSCAPPAPTPPEKAAAAVAYSAKIVAERLAIAASDLQAPVAMTASQMREAVLDPAIDDAGNPVPVELMNSIVYASAATANTMSISVFLRGTGQGQTSFGPGPVFFAYGCAEFRADFTSRQATVHDTQCSPRAAEWLPQNDTELVSVDEVSADALTDASW